MDMSDDEPEMRTFASARQQEKERSVLNPTIAKKNKKRAPRPRKTGEEKAAPKDVVIKTINPSLLDIINEEVPTAKIQEAAKEIEKNEHQLEKLRNKGESKKIVIEKIAPVQKKLINNIEVVFVKKDFKPKGNAEAAAKATDFRNKMFARNDFHRVPLAKILKK